MAKIKFSFPRGNYPRLCLIGNSNVGKSSLTRLLLSHPAQYKGKVGKTAGSTVRLTIINDPALNYHVIDLPGFGKMTHLDRKSEGKVQDQILHYIQIDRKNIFLMLMVISADRLGEELEKYFYQNEETIPLTIEFLQYFIENNIPTLIILNKIDKINTYQIRDIREKLADVLDHFEIKVQGEGAKAGLLDIVETSTLKDIGIKSLKQFIRKRALSLNMKAYDSRKTLMNRPTIDVIAYEEQKALENLNSSLTESRGSAESEISAENRMFISNEIQHIDASENNMSHFKVNCNLNKKPKKSSQGSITPKKKILHNRKKK